MSLVEYHCKDRLCRRLLVRTDAAYGRIEVVCPRCKTRQTIYVGGYQQKGPRLTVVGDTA